MTQVSIHAHVRWATYELMNISPAHGGFNPRPRTVGDSSTPSLTTANRLFQSTPTYGGRPEVREVVSALRAVSIHAHVRWATVEIGNENAIGEVSIHAHVRWATRLLGRLVKRRKGFNPRPRTVGDPHQLRQRCPGVCFNPRPRTVGDGQRARDILKEIGFQSTPTYGGRRAGRLFLSNVD